MADPRLNQIFESAIGLPPGERAAEVARLCAGDAALEARCLRMLELADQASGAGFLEEGAAGHVLRDSPNADLSPGAAALLKESAALGLRPPKEIGPYRILGVLGEGGFGVVYAAERREPIKQRVALKVIKPGMDSRAVIARFEQERQALAVMSHPNIARVLDAGVTDEALGSRPYFVMEHVAGEPITEYCDRHNLTLRQRLELFIPVCEAVQHSHHKGIIHRDIKPSNILVAVVDDKPVPKVIDFGVAKATAKTITDATIFTEQGQLIGTPEYMSPEQAEMGATDIDTRTDVYSLGAVLYELLTGAVPFDSKSLRAAALIEIQRIIREVEAPKPSTRLTSLGAEESTAIAHHRQIAREALASELRRELDWVPLKALRKDRTERYATPKDLADDIQNYLEGRPLNAGPEAARYRVRKFVRRNRGPVIAGSLVAATLLLATGVSIGFAVVADRQRARAEGEWDRAEGLLVERDGALADEKARSEQLQIVADFQAEQLGSVDAAAMGLGLRRDLVSSYSDQLRTAGIEPAEAQRRTGELDASLNGVDFTGLALASLEAHVFNPALDAIARRFHDQPVVQSLLLQTLASVLHGAGLLQAAEAPQREALEIRRHVLGSEHPDTLSSINNMGLLLHDQGKLAEAEPYYREALDASRRVLGDEHPSTLSNTNNMGFLLRDQGKLAEAEPYYREALDTRRRVLGDEHPDTLSSINNMGWLLRSQGKLAEAEPYCREALDARRRVLGSEHPSTLISISNMGSLLRAQGKLAEAELFYREALDGRRRVLGDEHPNTLTSINYFGELLQAQGKLAEAELFCREALDARRRVLGSEHQDTLISISNMGSLLQSQGKLAEAIDLLLPAAHSAEATLPEQHRVVRAIRGQVVRVARALHEAEPGAGYDAIAAEWQAKIDQANQDAPNN